MQSTRYRQFPKNCLMTWIHLLCLSDSILCTLGLHFLSSQWWCPTAVTLGILCLGLLVILIILTMQCKYWNREMMEEKVRTYKHGLLIGFITTINSLDLGTF